MRRAIVLLGLVAACGGSDDPKPIDAPGECKATVSTLAAKNADCAVETGHIQASQRDQYVADFTAGASTTLDCSRMTKVLGNPDACAMEQNAMPCSSYSQQTGLPLPASCKGLYGK
jgi:hypothetical protein